MPTRPLSDFFPLVLPHVAGCPHPVAEQYLRLAAIDWCERTKCWRHVATTTLSAAQDEAIVAPAYATIHEIESAYLDGTKLTPTQFSSHDPQDLAADGSSRGPAQYITQSKPNTVSVIPFQSGALRLTLFLKPRSATEYGNDPQNPVQVQHNVVPDFILTQDAETVAFGALSRLMLLKDTAWYDPQRASYFEAKFETRANSKFAKSMRGQHRARKRTRAHWL